MSLIETLIVIILTPFALLAVYVLLLMVVAMAEAVVNAIMEFLQEVTGR